MRTSGLRPRGGKRLGVVLATVALLLGAAAPSAASAAEEDLSPYTIWFNNFESGRLAPWAPSGGSVTVERQTIPESIGLSHATSMRVAGRAATGEGAALPLADYLTAGERSTISVWTRLHPGTPATTVRVGVEQGGTVVPVASGAATADGWIEIVGDYTPAAGAELGRLLITADAVGAVALDGRRSARMGDLGGADLRRRARVAVVQVALGAASARGRRRHLPRERTPTRAGYASSCAFARASPCARVERTVSATTGSTKRSIPPGLASISARTWQASPRGAKSNRRVVGMIPALLRAAITTGGSKCVTRQSYSTSRPMTRMRVRRVVPGRTGGAEVISSEITDVSQRERFAGSVRYANTAAGSRSIRIVSATVNMPSSSPTPAFPGPAAPNE